MKAEILVTLILSTLIINNTRKYIENLIYAESFWMKAEILVALILSTLIINNTRKYIENLIYAESFV